MPEPTKESSRDLYVAVAIGGAIGACARYAAELAAPVSGTSWPWATFVVNISGALILGMLLAVAEAKFPDPKASVLARRYRPFLITGVLGGYTTFSTFMVEAHGLINGGASVKAVAYIVTSVVLGVVAYLVGLTAGALLMKATGATDSVAELEEETITDVIDEDEA